MKRQIYLLLKEILADSLSDILGLTLDKETYDLLCDDIITNINDNLDQ